MVEAYVSLFWLNVGQCVFCFVGVFIFSFAVIKRRELWTWLMAYTLLGIGFIFNIFRLLPGMEELFLIANLFYLLSGIAICFAVIKEYYETLVFPKWGAVGPFGLGAPPSPIEFLSNGPVKN